MPSVFHAADPADAMLDDIMGIEYPYLQDPPGVLTNGPLNKRQLAAREACLHTFYAEQRRMEQMRQRAKKKIKTELEAMKKTIWQYEMRNAWTKNRWRRFRFSKNPNTAAQALDWLRKIARSFQDANFRLVAIERREKLGQVIKA